EGDAHEHVAARLEAGELLSCREVRGFEGVRAAHTLDVPKLLVGRPLDPHARRTIAAAPDDHRSVVRIGEVETLLCLRPVALRRDNRRRTFGQSPNWQNRAGRGSRPGLQEAPPGSRDLVAHVTLRSRGSDSTNGM